MLPDREDPQIYGSVCVLADGRRGRVAVKGDLLIMYERGAVLWIRIRMDPDPHGSASASDKSGSGSASVKLDPDPDLYPHRFADEKPKCMDYEPI